jgi:beta-glucosidase
LSIQDGPQGLRTKWKTGGPGTTTCWPSSLTAAATWDRDLLFTWATEMSSEFKAKGVNLQLGPGIGLARVPTAGRNWEYLSGEDPFLGAMLVTEVIKGIQGNGVIANAKHFINNEIEEHRMTMSSNVDERTRFELYYPPFQAAIDAGVLSLMCSYNRINDVYGCQNNETLSFHLREIMGFEGWVMSDWTATKATTDSLKAGLDQEMPYGIFYSEKALNEQLAEGTIQEEDINQSALRILTAMYTVGVVDTPIVGDPTANVTSDAHNALARKIAAEAIVLLENKENSLPLNPSTMMTSNDCIAIFGDQTKVSGSGSGSVSPPYIITPSDGIQRALQEENNNNNNIQVLYNDGSDLATVTALAQQCSVALVLVSTDSREGSDRESLSLGEQQDSLVTTVASVNPHTIVSANIPGAILMPWSNHVNISSILIAWYPGQEYGNALADVLFGKINPHARLPLTIPNKENEIGFTPRQYPGVGFPPEAYYTEELLIGYRWYEANNVVPLFPFGHGLSYTTFVYGNAHNSKSEEMSSLLKKKKFPNKPKKSYQVVNDLSFTLENTGKRDGSEVVQLYVSYPKMAREPPKQLRNFMKVDLTAGETKTVSFTVSERDIAIWNSEDHLWEIVPGEYKIMVGASSQDIRLTKSFVVSA